MADMKIDLGKKAKATRAPGKKKAEADDQLQSLADVKLPPASNVLTTEDGDPDAPVVTRLVVMQRDYGQKEKKPYTMSDIKV